MIDRGHYFEATAEHVNQLTDNECVDLFYQMLKADAEEIGMPVTSVYTGLDSVQDGGVDASVDLEPPSDGHLIVGSCPSYQIKAGKSFKPWNNAEIEKELFGKREHEVKGLGRQTERCFANRRTYILVCMKVKLNAQQRDDAIGHLKQAGKNMRIARSRREGLGTGSGAGSPEHVSILGHTGKQSEHQRRDVSRYLECE